MAAGGCLLACGLRASLIVRSAAASASPVAVLPAAFTPASASRTAAWSRVGVCRTVGLWLNATAPTRTSSGTSSRNVPAARRAATSRLGATSFASIEPERSVVITTVACSTGTATVTCGRASATIRPVAASPRATTGACRRQRGRRGETASMR